VSNGRQKEARPGVIAVVGGAGFLGSHLCERLVASGHRVFCIDNFYTGRRRNVSHLSGSRRLEIVEHDILAPIPAGLPQFDEIYNLGCPASPVHYQADPVKTRVGFAAQGTLNCSPESRGRWGLASSMPRRRKSMETRTSILRPRTIMATSTRWAPDHATMKASGSPKPWSRIFGRRFGVDDQDRAHFQHLRTEDAARRRARRLQFRHPGAASEDQTSPSTDPASKTRSFCFVDDLIDGFLKLMRANSRVEGPVNLGNPEEYDHG